MGKERRCEQGREIEGTLKKIVHSGENGKRARKRRDHTEIVFPTDVIKSVRVSSQHLRLLLIVAQTHMQSA